MRNHRLTAFTLFVSFALGAPVALAADTTAPASWSLDPKSVGPATLRAAVLIGRLLQTTN